MTPEIIAEIEAEIEWLRVEREVKIAAEECEIAQRRFGSRHDKPCRRLTILTCALWECQQANECQHGA